MVLVLAPRHRHEEMQKQNEEDGANNSGAIHYPGDMKCDDREKEEI